MTDIFQKILELKKSGRPSALVTVIKTRGSTPRGSGSKMIVEPDGEIHGTIGGSSVEAMVIEEAREVIASGKSRVVTHNLNDEQHEDTGMVCGGIMEFFIEPLNTAPHVYIFGGGHVALPLARLLAQTGFTYTLIDDREKFASAERFPEALNIHVGDPAKIAEELEILPSDFIAIVTRCHDHDYTTLRAVIKKKYRYLGLIGSRNKRRQIFERLQKNDGIQADLLEKVHAPIGLDIEAETPEEIAVSIVAEMIAIKNRRAAQKKLSKKTQQ